MYPRKRYKPVVVSLFLKTAVHPCESPPVQLVLPPKTWEGDSRPLLSESRNVTEFEDFSPAAAAPSLPAVAEDDDDESGPQPKMWSLVRECK
jgi:hypothetical protein